MSSNLPGSSNPNWKGGRTITPAGYVLIKEPSHPAADVRGYVYEHRLVMERELGRLLAPGERVRRKDKDPGNNDPANLILVKPLDRRATVTCACGCGSVMTVLDRCGRARRYLTGHNFQPRARRQAQPFQAPVRRPRSETTAGLDPQWRAEALAEFRGLCAYGCGRPATEWDHIIAWCRGGSFKTTGNAVPVCHSCNQAKRDSADPWPWLDRGLASAQGDALADVIALGVSWGTLWVPDDDQAVA